MNKTELIDKLNGDLADELGAIIQYITYAAQTTGPYRPQLAAFFEAEIPDEQSHARFLAEKIVALGGTPTKTSSEVAGTNGNKQMLEAVLAAERRAVKNYTERAQQAEEAGEKGLAIALEDLIKDETNHAEESERMLRDWAE